MKLPMIFYKKAPPPPLPSYESAGGNARSQASLLFSVRTINSKGKKFTLFNSWRSSAAIIGAM